MPETHVSGRRRVPSEDPSVRLPRAAGTEGELYVGSTEDDRFKGTANDDVFDLSAGGHDSAKGGAGDDLFNLNNAFDALDRLSGSSGYDTLSTRDVAGSLTITRAMAFRIEALTVSNSQGKANITLADGVSFRAFSTWVYEDEGSVRIDASALTANLVFTSRSRHNVLIGGSGDDLFVADAYYMAGNTFNGGAGEDTVSFAAAVSGRTVDLRPAGTPGATYRLVGIENIVGTGFSDTLTGSAADNWFVSNGFDDRLVGLGGDDAFTVGRGLGYSAEPRTVVDGGTGIDLLDFDDLGRATGYVVVDLGKTGFQDTRGGGTMQITSVENISGTAFDDYLTGGRGANALYGGGGGDTLRGGDGNDLLLGDQSMAGTKDGVHYIAPRLATARTGGDDALYGGAGNDRLFGHAGDDLLIGDRGADELTGGLGKDIFYYHGIGDSRGKGIDTILDFGRGDRIHVAHIDADTSERGNQAFHFGATADHTGDIIVHFDAAAGMTIADFHVDGDGIADMTIHLAGEIVLTARDFVL